MARKEQGKTGETRRERLPIVAGPTRICSVGKLRTDLVLQACNLNTLGSQIKRVASSRTAAVTSMTCLKIKCDTGIGDIVR